ncbi:MAG: hypothetical protein AAGB46_03360 [Verrucomicrobiota bacterium]
MNDVENLGDSSSEERPAWQEEARRDPVVDSEGALGRMQRILESLIDEMWLPMGLRTMLAEEITSLRDQLEKALIELGKVAERIHAVALSTFSYSDLMSRSETVAQLRILDLELNPGRYSGSRLGSGLVSGIVAH